MSGVLVSIQIGRPRTITGHEPWVTSFFKVPVTGPIRVDTNNLDGDEQADLSVHGGPDKAICVYSADHFAAWSSTVGLRDCGPGAFRENFSVRGLTELPSGPLRAPDSRVPRLRMCSKLCSHRVGKRQIRTRRDRIGIRTFSAGIREFRRDSRKAVI